MIEADPHSHATSPAERIFISKGIIRDVSTDQSLAVDRSDQKASFASALSAIPLKSSVTNRIAADSP
jgi:hypothetical protein